MLFLLVVVSSVRASFHPSFHQFLVNHYGPSLASALSRDDMGGGGSFGGHPIQFGRRASQQAVVLVHGITNRADTFGRIRDHLQGEGHEDGSVYATTYGDGGKTMAPMVAVKCEYIKQVRSMIQSVAAYTRRKVDVIAFSMGAPVARKAILGGLCVDTRVSLGPPLSSLVDTFVSVAGANHGSFLCLLPFPGACNALNGLSCRSSLLSDVNSMFSSLPLPLHSSLRSHYEGDFVFSIFSRNDDKVGFQNGCGEVTSRIGGQNAEFQRGGSHDEVMFSSAGLQNSLIVRHAP